MIEMQENKDQPGAGATPVAEAPDPPDLSQAALEKYPNLEKVLNLELPVIVVLAEKSATVEEVLNLNEGSVIVFKKHNSEPLDILVNNRRIGAGKTIKIGERFGVHVREVGTPQELLAKIR